MKQPHEQFGRRSHFSTAFRYLATTPVVQTQNWFITIFLKQNSPFL